MLEESLKKTLDYDGVRRVDENDVLIACSTIIIQVPDTGIRWEIDEIDPDTHKRPVVIFDHNEVKAGQIEHVIIRGQTENIHKIRKDMGYKNY